MHKGRIALISVALSFLFLSGCESVNSGFGGVLNLDTDLKVTFDVSSDINPDEAGRSSPLYVRLYQLKSDTLFEKTDFIDLYEQDAEKLKADFVSKQELKLLKPGEDRIETFVLNEETLYIGFFAEFFQYKDAKYKIILPVTANNLIRNSIKVRITGNEIQLVD